MFWYFGGRLHERKVLIRISAVAAILEGVASALSVGGCLDDGCLGLRILTLVGVFGDVLARFGTRLSSLSSTWAQKLSDRFGVTQKKKDGAYKDVALTRVHEVLVVHNLANGLLGGTHGAVVGVGDFVSHYR